MQKACIEREMRIWVQIPPEHSQWWVLKGFQILSQNIHQSWARRSQSNLDPISLQKWNEQKFY